MEELMENKEIFDTTEEFKNEAVTKVTEDAIKEVTSETANTSNEDDSSKVDEVTPEKSKGDTQKLKEDKEPIFFVDADGKTKNVYGQEAYEKATAEKEEILRKRRNKRIGAMAISVILLGLIGTAGHMWYVRDKAAKEALSVETVEETTTEEDLNIPINNLRHGDGEALEDLVEGGSVLAEGNEESESLAGESSSTESKSDSGVTQLDNTETDTTETGVQETTLSQPDLAATVEDTEEAPVETIDAEAFDELQRYYESIAESVVNDEEYQKFAREHNND